mgnify:CR=1 FL=1
MKLWPLLRRLIPVGSVGLILLITTLVWASPERLFTSLTGYDPLSLEEQQTAYTLALAHDQVQSLIRGQRTAVLLVERHDEPKSVTQFGSWARRADVYVYNYNQDQLLHVLVDLSARTVSAVETLQEVQLPLTEAEVAAAYQRVLADPVAGGALRRQFQAVTGAALDQPEQQLKYRALIFRASAMPDVPLGAAAECGRRRCAQLLIATQGDVLIDLLPIVDLSADRVASASGFFSPEAQP